MATIEQLSAALVKADAAGNTADAKALADAIRQMQSATPELPESLRRRTEPEGIPAARQEPKMWQTIRPFVAPTVEALGAAGGAMLGGTAGMFGGGPVGAAAGGVAGAGLGYGIAKEALELGDVYLGGKAPRQGIQQVAEPVKNIVEGATFETGGRVAANVAGPLIAKGVGKIADLRQIPKNEAAKIARNALGPDLPEVLNTLKASQGQGVSAAQATANINSPTWQALIDRATARDPRFLRALEQSQGEISLNALTRLAGGTTAAETRATTELAKQNLNAVTGPAREASLNRANLGKAVAEFEAQAGKLSDEAAAKVQEVRDLINAGNVAEASARLNLIKKNLPVGLTKYTYAGELAEKAANQWSDAAAKASLDLGEGARVAQSAADSLRSVGIKPLEGAPLVQRLQGITQNPEFAGNDVMRASVDNLARDIAEWTGKGGVIDARALDAIRKNSVNAAVRDLLKGQDPTIQREAAASVMSKIKPMLIDAIENSGGAGYREYLEQYTKGMQKISERKLTGEALRLWKTDKDAFVRLVQNESPEVVEKFLGKGNYNIATELSDNAMATLEKEAQKRLTELSVKGQVSAGQDALKQLLLQNTNKFRLPSYLSAVAATTNKALSILENKIGVKTMSTLTEALKTPEGAANLLESLPAEERSRVLQLIGNPSKWTSQTRNAVTGATAGTVNMLAPSSENQNSLAP